MFEITLKPQLDRACDLISHSAHPQEIRRACIVIYVASTLLYSQSDKVKARLLIKTRYKEIETHFDAFLHSEMQVMDRIMFFMKLEQADKIADIITTFNNPTRKEFFKIHKPIIHFFAWHNRWDIIDIGLKAVNNNLRGMHAIHFALHTIKDNKMNHFETTFLELGTHDQLSMIFDPKYLVLHHLTQNKNWDSLTKILLLVKPSNRLFLADSKNQLGNTFLHTMAHSEPAEKVYSFLKLFEKEDRMMLLYEFKNNNDLSVIDIITKQSLFNRSSKLNEHKPTPAERAGMLL